MPAKFKFKLEALLEHRRLIEKERQRDVAKIQQEIQTILRHIQDTQARIVQENRTLGARELTGKLDMQYIAHEKRFIGALQVRIILAAQKLGELEKMLNEARARLFHAAQQRKIIEKLREKQFAEWRQEMDRKEAAILD